MLQLTRIEKAILGAIVEAGGELESLCSLATELEISYSHAHQRVCILEFMGVIEIERRQGKPLLLRFTAEDAIEAAEAVQPAAPVALGHAH
jgi:hypothetical protein